MSGFLSHTISSHFLSDAAVLACSAKACISHLPAPSRSQKASSHSHYLLLILVVELTSLRYTFRLMSFRFVSVGYYFTMYSVSISHLGGWVVGSGYDVVTMGVDIGWGLYAGCMCTWIDIGSILGLSIDIGCVGCSENT